MLNMDNLTEHDRQLVAQANAITNPINWWDVPDEDEADSPDVKEFLHHRRSYLYHREEGPWI